MSNYYREWYLRNKEKKRLYNEEYYRLNKARIRQKQKEYYDREKNVINTQRRVRREEARIKRNLKRLEDLI